MAVITDERYLVSGNPNTVGVGSAIYATTPIRTMDYYPFGLEMNKPDTDFGEFAGYRFGFNGKEADSDSEWGSATHYDYGFRIYNPSIGKFLSVDPLSPDYPWYTPYQFAGNMPIWAIDLDGLEPQISTGQKQAATDLIDNFEREQKNYTEYYYGVIEKASYIADLRQKVSNPEGIYQRETPLCGAAISCLNMAEFDIDGYTATAIGLYKSDSSNVNGLNLESSMEQMVASGSYPLGSAGRLSPVDYVMMTALKNKGNLVNQYIPGRYDNLGNRDQFYFDGLDGFTYPTEVTNRLTEFGLNVRSDYSPFISSIR